MKQHRVCIGVPVYNGGSLFAEMMESLLAQTFADFEIFIADNCSTDDTGVIARGFAERDRRVHYHKNATNIGAYPNFQGMLALIGNFKYFKWAAHDDLYKPTFLEECVNVLESEPDIVLAHTIVEVVDETEDHLLIQHPFYKLGRIGSDIDKKGRPVWMMGPLHLAETVDPATRYEEFLNRLIACFPIFGVIRSAALRGVELRPYFGGDRTFLAELVLKGRFRQVDEALFINRYHKSVSRLLSTKQQQAFVGGSVKRLSAQRQQQIDLLRAPFRTGMRPLDCWRCFGVAARHILRRETGRLLRSVSPSLQSMPRATERSHP
jgi:glycosyltransferase involved in cell wall biosynthesis